MVQSIGLKPLLIENWFLCLKISVMPRDQTLDTRIYSQSPWLGYIAVMCRINRFISKSLVLLPLHIAPPLSPSILLKLDRDISLLLVNRLTCNTYKVCFLWKTDNLRDTIAKLNVYWVISTNISISPISKWSND